MALYLSYFVFRTRSNSSLELWDGMFFDRLLDGYEFLMGCRVFAIERGFSSILDIESFVSSECLVHMPLGVQP